MTSQDSYRLLDTGDEKKLEQIGPHRVVRQAAQAHWPTRRSRNDWGRVAAVHHRAKTGGGHWEFAEKLPEDWTLAYGGFKFKIKLTDFGHVGLFPEQIENWRWITEACARLEAPRVLNLFGYTGGSTLAAARGDASVTHVDASKGVVSWARENAALSNLGEKSIRWIVEDVSKYVEREVKRGNRYQGLILDPPTFGRGPRGQRWKIEDHLVPFLRQLRKIMEPLQFILLSCHTPGYSPLCLANVLHQVFDLPVSAVQPGEMVVPIAGSQMVLPSGTYARWQAS
ncbi:MAG: class I SAM-dependent methyltransferase [Acidobacteriota bacterium]|nr:class I SAM-dependent methyltransferase [Acidobacteriota bacterium]